MIKTLSTLVDSQHFLHPKQLKEKSDHDQPTLMRRILGAALVALSIPFTLGIATGIFTYFAHRKVAHIEKQNGSDLDQRVEAAFGKAVEGTEKSPEQEVFEGAVRALHKGNKTELEAKVTELDPKSKDKNIKNALIAAAIAYDRFDEFNDLWSACGNVFIPLYEAKSPEMIDVIVDNLNGDMQVLIDRKYSGGNTALHHQQNLGVVKALTDRGAQFMMNDKGETPLHLCTDPKIAEHLIDHFGPEIITTTSSPLVPPPLFTVDNVDVLRVMIQKMEKIDTPLDNQNYNILHYFTIEPLKNHPELIHDVLKRFETDEERAEFVNGEIGGKLPILYFNKLPLEVVSALIEAGAEYPNQEGRSTPLHSCTNPEIADLFIKKLGKEILEAIDEKGRTPLMTVSSPEVQKLLIENGAKVDVVDKYEMNTIFSARSVEVAQILIKNGVDPNALDKYQGNALFGAITPEVAKWLIDEHGLKVDQKDLGGKEAIHFIHKDNIAMAKVLIGNRDHQFVWGEHVPPVMGNPEFVQWMQAGKPDQ